MNEKQKHYAVLALISVGAIALLVWLMRQKGGAPSSVPSNADAAPGGGYPNSGPITPSQFDVGSSPLNLTYNYGPQTPTVKTGGEVDSGCGCDSAGASFVSVQNVPQDVLSEAQANFSSYLKKAS
jgi:hypothetical protein